MSPMLLHLAATLLQAIFSVVQEAGFLNTHSVATDMCQNGADFS